MECAREKEHFYQTFTNFKLNRQRIVTPGKNGSFGHFIPNPSCAEAIVSDR